MIRVGQNVGRPKPDQRLIPMADVTAETIAAVPIGSETILVDHNRGMVSGGLMTLKNREEWVSTLAGSDASETSHLGVVYLPPLTTPEQAVERAIESIDWTDDTEPTVEAVFDGLRNGWGIEGLRYLLHEVARQAQRPDA